MNLVIPLTNRIFLIILLKILQTRKYPSQNTYSVCTFKSICLNKYINKKKTLYDMLDL
jgi:hypothetical protein